MRVVLACNTRRGVTFLRKLRQLCPDDSIHVWTTQETPGEPKYVDDLIGAAVDTNSCFNKINGDLEVAAGTDLLLLVNWRRWVSPETYKQARLACCFHDSLLPRYRGFYPAVWAMLNGDLRTGVTLFKLAPGIDAGPIIDQAPVLIRSDDTINEVVDRLTDAYLELLVRNIHLLLAGNPICTPQLDSVATYTCRRLRGDDEIDWRQDADKVLLKIRALTYPYQGAWTIVDGRPMIIWDAKPASKLYEGSVPGAVVSRSVGAHAVVLAGSGKFTSGVALGAVQIEGEVCKPAGSVLEAGQRLGS